MNDKIYSLDELFSEEEAKLIKSTEETKKRNLTKLEQEVLRNALLKSVKIIKGVNKK